MAVMTNSSDNSRQEETLGDILPRTSSLSVAAERKRARAKSEPAISQVSRTAGKILAAVRSDYVGYFHIAHEASVSLKDMALHLTERAARQCKQRKESPVDVKTNPVTVVIGETRFFVGSLGEPEELPRYPGATTSPDDILLNVHSSCVSFCIIRGLTVVLVARPDPPLKVSTKNGQRPLLTAHVLFCSSASEATQLQEAVKTMVFQYQREKRQKAHKKTPDKQSASSLSIEEGSTQKGSSLSISHGGVSPSASCDFGFFRVADSPHKPECHTPVGDASSYRSTSTTPTPRDRTPTTPHFTQGNASHQTASHARQASFDFDGDVLTSESVKLESSLKATTYLLGTPSVLLSVLDFASPGKLSEHLGGAQSYSSELNPWSG